MQRQFLQSLAICSRIGGNYAKGLPNKALLLTVKSRAHIFAELFEIRMSDRAFFT